MEVLLLMMAYKEDSRIPVFLLNLQIDYPLFSNNSVNVIVAPSFLECIIYEFYDICNDGTQVSAFSFKDEPSGSLLQSVLRFHLLLYPVPKGIH